MGLLAIFLLALDNMARADEDTWTAADTVREQTYVVLHTIDWLQTRTIAKQGWSGRTEMNPLLGLAPSPGKLDALYAATSLGHYWISKAFPGSQRKYWQYITISGEGFAVAYNHSVGVRIKF